MGSRHPRKEPIAMSARIGLDVMGGDHGPEVTIAGAADALEQFPDVELLLVGREEEIEGELSRHDIDRGRIAIEPASEAIEMHESPVEALRKKPDSSLRRLVAAHKQGACQAIFSAGNTGAMVAASTMGLGLLPGVKRAGIGVAMPLPDRSHPALIIDVGANVQCKPRHLFEYAVMATSFMEHVYGVSELRVGILNVGEEEQKGNPLVKGTRELLGRSELNVIGNVEGGDIFSGAAEVIVCDGFVGNIVLKTAEGLSEKLLGTVLAGVKHLLENVSAGGDEAGEHLRQLAARFDYAEYGGAPLLGVDGTAVIGHGRSDRRAVTNAIRWARRMLSVDIRGTMVAAIEKHSERLETE
jgi:glycerol-3-phosphate acyltransferase PlsX